MNSKLRLKRNVALALAFSGLALPFYLRTTRAQQVPTTAQKQTAGTHAINLTASSTNTQEPGIAVRVNIFRWSNDQERNELVATMNPRPPASPTRGARVNSGDAPRGGRRGRGAPVASGPVDPIDALAGAIAKAPTIGYVWTNEVAGYSIKYAFHASLPGGSERIILATNRRLGAYSAEWQPVAPATPTDYRFTLIEVQLDPKGLGEGKTSLTTKVIVDKDANTIALDNYAATPAILKNVKY
jgi:hypothetical protein